MRKSALIALIAAAPLAAVANPFGVPASSGPSYDYIGGGYANLNPDGSGSLDGFGIDGSVALHENFHAMVDFVRGKDSPFTARRTRVAGGYHMPLNPRTDFVARLGWSFSKSSVSGFGSFSDDGVLGQVGVRGMMSEALELNAFLTYDDIDSKASVDVGGVYHFTPQFGATGGYSYSSDLEVVNVGLRFQF